MSYIPFRQKCEDCGEEWNTAFGILGTTIIAESPKTCPHCNSKNLKRLAEEWKDERPTQDEISE